MFFVVWRGAGIQAYAFLLFSLVGFVVAQQWLQTRFHYLERPLSLAGTIAVVGVLLGFVLTRRALSHSSHAYRGQANPFGGMLMDTGK